jgi:hypothetical protein
MKKIVIALTLSAVALSSAYAAPNAGTLSPEKAAAKKVTCNVQTLADAEKCMEKVARARPSYENANEGFASKDVSKLADVLKVLSRKDEDVQQAVGSDFAGVMLEYGDEFHIYYFAIKKGQNVKPVELYDLNTVDFEFLLTTPPARST